jgi:hypothetical protein
MLVSKRVCLHDTAPLARPAAAAPAKARRGWEKAAPAKPAQLAQPSRAPAETAAVPETTAEAAPPVPQAAAPGGMFAYVCCRHCGWHACLCCESVS